MKKLIEFFKPKLKITKVVKLSTGVSCVQFNNGKIIVI